MAFSLIQTKQVSSSSVTTLTITPTAALGTGRLVLVSLKFASGTPSSVTVTDNALTPNTYLSVGAPVSGGGATACYQFYGVQVTGGATIITVSWATAATIRATVEEYSGGMPSNATVFDQAHTASGTGTTASVVSFSPANTGELISAVTSWGTSGTISAGSGYTLSQSSSSQSVEYKLASIASETAPTNNATSSTWAQIVAAYTPAPVLNSSTGFFSVM